MITPSMTKREQMMKQAEAEQRQYEEHRERTRLRNIHEVHRLGSIISNKNACLYDFCLQVVIV